MKEPSVKQPVITSTKPWYYVCKGGVTHSVPGAKNHTFLLRGMIFEVPAGTRFDLVGNTYVPELIIGVGGHNPIRTKELGLEEWNDGFRGAYGALAVEIGKRLYFCSDVDIRSENGGLVELKNLDDSDTLRFADADLIKFARDNPPAFLTVLGEELMHRTPDGGWLPFPRLEVI